MSATKAAWGSRKVSGRTATTLVRTLQEQITRLERRGRACRGRVVSSGWPRLDQLLPFGGFREGTLVEWLAQGRGTGVHTVAFCGAREAVRAGRLLVVVDRAGEFYPPAAVRLGIDLDRLLVLQVASSADLLWALDQVLRSPAVGAVVAPLTTLDSRAFRRLQLAGEEGGGVAMLLRPASARSEPSWADVRLEVQPLPSRYPQSSRRVRIHVVRSRGPNDGAWVEVEVPDEAHPMPVVSPLACAADSGRATGT